MERRLNVFVQLEGAETLAMHAEPTTTIQELLYDHPNLIRPRGAIQRKAGIADESLLLFNGTSTLSMQKTLQDSGIKNRTRTRTRT